MCLLGGQSLLLQMRAQAATVTAIAVTNCQPHEIWCQRMGATPTWPMQQEPAWEGRARACRLEHADEGALVVLAPLAQHARQAWVLEHPRLTLHASQSLQRYEICRELLTSRQRAAKTCIVVMLGALLMRL